MRYMIAKIGLVMALLLTAPAAHAQEAPIVLQPTTQWEVNYAENECRLLRSFGSGDQMVILRLARASSLEHFDLVLAGAGVPNLDYRPTTTLRLEPQGAETVSDGYSTQIPNRPDRFLRLFDADSTFLAQFTPSQILGISAQNMILRLNLTNVQSAIAALQTCHDDLLSSWGFDAAAYRALRSPPKAIGNEVAWVTTDDYPATEATGTTGMRLLIGVDGRISNCVVIKSSGSTLLDTAACRALIRRARFEPAIGADGVAIGALFLKRVRWTLD